MPDQSPESQLLQERSTGIGGSDAHHIHSLPPYGCVRRLWYEKVGVPMDEPREMTNAMRRGQRLEEIAAEFYEEKTGRDVSAANKVRRHPKHPEILAHLDRRILSIDARGPGVLELKVVGQYMFQKIKEEGPPDAYLFQVQHGMLASSWKWGAMGIYWADGDQMLAFDQDGNQKLQESHVAACLDFWRRVKNDDPPPRLNMHTDEHERCASCPWKETCQGPAMAELVERQRETLADPAMIPLMQRYIQIAPLAKKANEELERVEAEIKVAMRDRIEVHVPMPDRLKAPKISFKPQLAWDTKALERDHPELAEKFMRLQWRLGDLTDARPDLARDYKRPSTTRPLRIYTFDKEKKK